MLPGRPSADEPTSLPGQELTSTFPVDPGKTVIHPSAPDPGGVAGSGSSKVWTAGTLTYSFSGLFLVFLWLLLGDFAWSMRDRSVSPMAQWYLNHLNVPNLLFGLLISSFPAFIGVFLGPIISVKSDRHRGKWGRRIPFLMITTPIAAIGMVGLAVTPLIAEWMHGFFPQASPMVVAVCCFGVFWTAFEIATIASQAVFNGLINDVVPRELLGRFYGLFRAVSLIDGIIFNYWIMGKVPDHFVTILSVIGVFYGVSFLWICFKVKEGDYPPPPPLETTRQNAFVEGARMYMRECFYSSYYVWLFVLLVVSNAAFMPVNIFSIPYAKSLGVDMAAYGKCLALTYAISLTLAYPLGWLADVVHPLRMTILTVAGYVLVCIWGWFFALTPQAFLTTWVLHGVLSGCFFTSSASLALRLFPRDKFAQFASAAGILGAPLGMALAPFMGTLLDTTGNMYRLTFVVGGVLAIVALFAGCIVHGRFMKLGGNRNYVAPQRDLAV